MGRRPNILILYADQMQHDHMGFVDGVAYTPNLDRLAREGVHFTHAITEQGQCVPSRAVLLTGASAHECGVMVNYGFDGHHGMLTRKHRTFAQVVREAGYTTAWFGKGHLGSPLADLGFDHGDTFDASNEKSTSGRALDPEDKKRLGCEYVPAGIDVDYKATEDAVRFVDNHDTARPLCLVMSLHFPHPPLFSEKRFIKRFPPASLPIPESFSTENFEGKPAFLQERAAMMKAGGYTEQVLRQSLADYYSMIAAADDHFGRVMDAFRNRSMWDNTIVLFTSDHGDMMGAHGFYAKGTYPYDELYRIPCLMKLPEGMTSERRTIDDLVSSQAYAGTLLRLARLPVPASFTGADFTAAFAATAHPQDERVFFEHYMAHWGLHPFYGVRTRTHKYVRWYGAEATEELYDLSADPHELQNLAFDKLHADSKKELSGLADEWWKSTGGRDVAYYESADFKANKHNT